MSPKDKPLRPWPFFRDKVARWLVLAVIAYLAVRMLQQQPSEVELQYHLQPVRQGLVQVSMRYLRQGEEVRRVRFDYTLQQLSSPQVHRVNLPDGQYTVQLALVYRGAPPAAVDSAVTRLAHGRQSVSLSREFAVSGSSRVNIYLTGGKRRDDNHEQ